MLSYVGKRKVQCRLIRTEGPMKKSYKDFVSTIIVRFESRTSIGEQAL